MLAESKLNTFADHVSTTLVDGRICDEEFRLTLVRVGRYYQMKAKIWVEARKKHAELTGTPGAGQGDNKLAH